MKTKAILMFLILIAIQFSGFSNSDKNCAELKLEKISLYQALKLCDIGLDEVVFDKAITGLNCLLLKGKLKRNDVISIIDFSQSSNSKRLYIIDLKKEQVLFNTYVAHGRNSGEEYAYIFSNKENSFQSSLGFYITDKTYKGNHGISLRLKGVEVGINDSAEQRGIVIHGANYVAQDFIKKNGRLGRSLGCPAVSEEMCLPVINATKNGTCIFIYKSDQNYSTNSALIN
jgi:hypothetical protein